MCPGLELSEYPGFHAHLIPACHVWQFRRYGKGMTIGHFFDDTEVGAVPFFRGFGDGSLSDLAFEWHSCLACL